MSEMSDMPTRTVAILVVEDDPSVGELLGTVLKDVPGWTATVAHDAAMARSVFQQVEIDVLVIDINLPGITGLELLDQLRGEPTWRAPAVILMSAVEDQPGVREALATSTAARFIAKPMNLDDLVGAIRETVDR